MIADPGAPVREYQSDHDLLVRLDERYGAIHKDIKEIKDGSQMRLDALERRVALLELWRSALLGAQALGLILLPLALTYFHA